MDKYRDGILIVSAVFCANTILFYCQILKYIASG